MDKDKSRLTEQGQFKKIQQCWRIHTSLGSGNLSSLLPIDFRTLHKKAYFHIAKQKKKKKKNAFTNAKNYGVFVITLTNNSTSFILQFSHSVTFLVT